MQQFTGLEYIKIDMANQFGLDKLTWDERLAWTDKVLENQDAFDDAVANAEEPIRFLKAFHAYEDAINGVPTGFIMGLDATASFLQIMACLSGCIKTASACNLVNTGKREDPYTMITERLEMDIPRSKNKYAIMTNYYNSKAKPREIYGEDTPELERFYQVLLQEFPGAEQIKADAQSLWQSDVEAHQWTLPDGHVARIRVGEYEEKKIEIPELQTAVGQNATFTHRGLVFQPADYGISLPANIIHSLDAWIMRELRARCAKSGFTMLGNHDAFFCSPNHMNTLRQHYVDILVWICEHDVFATIGSEITGEELSYPKGNSEQLAHLIKESEYALS